MVDLTLFELHFEDASFTANAPFSRGSGEDEDEEDGGIVSEKGGGPSKLLLAVIVLGGTAAVTWLLRNRQTPDIAEEMEVTP